MKDPLLHITTQAEAKRVLEYLYGEGMTLCGWPLDSATVSWETYFKHGRGIEATVYLHEDEDGPCAKIDSCESPYGAKNWPEATLLNSFRHLQAYLPRWKDSKGLI